MRIPSLDNSHRGRLDARAVKEWNGLAVAAEGPMFVITLDGTALEFIPVPSGSFLMGSDNTFFGETPAHRVTIEAAFFLGKYPVTQAQWVAVMGMNPSVFLGVPDP